MPEQKTAPQRISQVLLQRFFTLTSCSCSKLLNHFCILSNIYFSVNLLIYKLRKQCSIALSILKKNLALLLFCNSHKCRLSIWGGDDKWDLKRQGIGPWRRLTDIHVLFTMIMLVSKGETSPKNIWIFLDTIFQVLTGIISWWGVSLRVATKTDLILIWNYRSRTLS